MRFKYATLLLGIASAAACATNQGSQGTAREVSGVRIVEEVPGLWARATFAADSAIKLAMARVPGGQITEAELEEENGRVVYSFEIKVTNQPGQQEVDVDASTGEVLKVEQDS